MEAEAKAAMPAEVKTQANVEQAVPFFSVTNIEESLRFYVDGLGFALSRKWIDEGKLRWCWLQLGGAALMLQEFKKKPEGKVGVGISVCFQCKDALAIYHETKARGLTPKCPFVGNGMWVTAFTDPDGYKIDFESPTDAEEETELEGEESQL
jgi:catechol 2,3-dioxygenase-like lactoylglutathione lyase family enzyme